MLPGRRCGNVLSGNIIWVCFGEVEEMLLGHVCEKIWQCDQRPLLKWRKASLSNSRNVAEIFLEWHKLLKHRLLESIKTGNVGARAIGSWAKQVQASQKQQSWSTTYWQLALASLDLDRKKTYKWLGWTQGNRSPSISNQFWNYVSGFRYCPTCRSRFKFRRNAIPTPLLKGTTKSSPDGLLWRSKPY